MCGGRGGGGGGGGGVGGGGGGGGGWRWERSAHIYGGFGPVVSDQSFRTTFTVVSAHQPTNSAAVRKSTMINKSRYDKNIIMQRYTGCDFVRH